MDKLGLRSVPYHKKKNSWGEEIYSTLLQHTWLMEETKIICMLLKSAAQTSATTQATSSGSWASTEPWPKCFIRLLLRQCSIFLWFLGFTTQKWHWPISQRTEECCDRKDLNKDTAFFYIYCDHFIHAKILHLPSSVHFSLPKRHHNHRSQFNE